MLKPYYKNSLGQLYNCDCRELFKELEDNSIDMVFTSPPYNTGNSGKNKDMYTEYNDDLTDEQYYNLLKDFLTESLRVCKGPIFLNINYMVNNKKVLYRIMYEFVDYLRENIIWDKGKCQPPIGNILGKRYEYILLFTKDDKIEINNFRKNKAIRYQNEFGNWISNVVRLNLESDQTEFSKTHRAGFPYRLPKMFIDIYTKENDIILDPFFGLGATAIAAEYMNRQWIGSELVENYCKIVKERLDSMPQKLI